MPPSNPLRALLCVALTTPLALGATEPRRSGRELADLSIEELMNESVTSVSKKEQRLGDVAAAVAVLHNDDLRRSGATTIADALRLVPGVNVGSLQTSRWAVSARGFNGPYANKLLVLVDGRAVYTPLYAGVYWDLQQPMLDDVDRVEVIRGPGATVWGANAVNGVISVVTRSARDTQGGLIFGGVGDVQRSTAGVRHGGRLGRSTYYRVFAARQATDDHPLANGQPAGDHAHTWQSGFRVDHYAQTGAHATWQADASASDFDGGRSNALNINTLARWSHTFSSRSGIEVQAYFDHTHRNEFARTRNTIDTADFSFQHTVRLGSRHDLIWGVGYRFIENDIVDIAPFTELREGDFGVQLFSAFVQDELRLVPNRLTLIVGTKIEHNDFTGFELQPSVRAVFKPAARQALWAAVSRAVRTPSELEGRNVFGVMVGEPILTPSGMFLPVLVGNQALRPEVLWAYEAGWRIQPRPQVSFELAAFYNDYRDLIGISETPRFLPGVPFGIAESSWSNSLRGETYGGEASLTVSPMSAWRLTASYARLHARVSGPERARSFDWAAPRHQFTVRSAHEFGSRVSIDAQLRQVSRVDAVPGYITADLRLAFRPTPQLELSLVGQNLLDPRQPEQPPDPAPGSLSAEVPRRVSAKFSWRF